MTVQINASTLHQPGSDGRRERPLAGGPLSMSRFAAFLQAAASDKAAEAAMIRREQGLYTAALDYWALLRSQIVVHHQYPPNDGRGALDAAVELAPIDRQWQYARAVAEYRRFLTGRRVALIGQPRPALWLDRGVQVQVNPELQLVVDGDPMVVKLYLRSPSAQALSPGTADALAHLLDLTHGHLGLPVVFDVFRGRVFGPPRLAGPATVRLRDEARALAQLWSELDGHAPTERLPTVPAA
ncbi:MAG: hypothetical protein AAGE88_21365 [Actinomycetota bacterium]